MKRRSSLSSSKVATTISRICIVGPIAALCTLPVDVIPQSIEGLSTVFIAAVFLLLIALFGVVTDLKLLRRTAEILIDRAANAKRNWEEDTLRSFLEVLCWLYATMDIYRLRPENPVIAGILGGLAGISMVILGEVFTFSFRLAEVSIASDSAIRKWKIGRVASGELVALLLSLIFGVVLRCRNTHTLGTATTSALLGGASLICLGQMMCRWAPTHRYGEIIQNRLVETKTNWVRHTFRSSFETSAWLAATWGSYAFVNDLLAATILGAISGLSICIIGELAFTENAHLSRLTHAKYSISDQEYSSESEDGWDTNEDKSVLLPEAPKNMIYREQAGVTGLFPVFHTSASQKKTMPVYRMKEIEAHNTKEDCWIVINDRVFDCTEFISKHPGGILPILHLAGHDATDAFEEYHPSHVTKLYLPRYYIGDLAEEDQNKATSFVQDARKLRQEFLREGLFETNPGYYVYVMLILLVLYATSISMALFGQSSLVRIYGSAVVMGLFWQQLAFLGHDIGHNNVTHVKKTDNYYGSLFGNALGGISLVWWKKNHDTHHVISNSVENDPDIQHLPLFAVTEKIFKNTFWSTYYEKWMKMDLPAKFLVSYQHILFYPVMMFARFNLYVQSWIMLLTCKNYPMDFRSLEIGSMLMFPVWITLLLSRFDDWFSVIAWLVISHNVAGILHVQICVSHFPMEHFHGGAYSGKEDDDWYRLQLKTTMNVSCPEWMDIFHGGLQFQIEHHLFPRIPRHNLRRIQPKVKALCSKYNVAYNEAGFFKANQILVSSMYEVAMKARTLKPNDAGIYEAAIFDGLNAVG